MAKNRKKIGLGIVTKLLILFTLSILIVVGTLLASVNILTEREFRRFIHENDVLSARDYAVLLERFYELNSNSWNGADSFINRLKNLSVNEEELFVYNGGEYRPISDIFPSVDFNDQKRLVVVDVSGRVVADSFGIMIGETHPSDHWEKGIPVTSGQKIVGSVFYGSMVDPILNPRDEYFLRSVNWSILLSALISVTVVLLLVYSFTTNIISPLKKLTQAVNRISNGELDVLVDVKSEDEINTLASQFNVMSRRLAEGKALRKRLAGDIAHEIRTPVTTIQGELEALLDGVYPLKREVIRSIYEDTVVLSNIIKDLELIESLEFNRASLKLAPNNIRELLDNACDSFKSAAAVKRINIIKDYARSLPAIEFDKQRIRQVLNNLLSNAIRYSPEGSSVEIGAKVKKNKLEISVRDTGRGIEEKDLEHIFDRFFRADLSRSRAEGGTGLGLAISKTLIEAHGGELTAESNVGSGSVFTIVLYR